MMTVKIGINGFGRIGRLAFRRILDLQAQGATDLEVVAINDLTAPDLLAHLLKYDSTQGTLAATVRATADALWVNEKRYPVYAQPQAAQLPWVKNDGVTIVLECSGFYTSKTKAQAHLTAGAQKVLISAPAGADVRTIVVGVNDDQLSADDRIVSAGSCTTNCLAPMAAVLDQKFGLKVGTMTTVHAYTSTQMLLDGPVRGGNLRAARAAGVNTIPHSSGAAKAIGLVLPQLNGKLQGHAQRVGVVSGSLTELVSILGQPVTTTVINEAMYAATRDNAAFGYNADQLVSSDVIGTTYGSIFDPTQTEVTAAGTQQLVKTVAWYDNEYGFTCQLIRTLSKLVH